MNRIVAWSLVAGLSGAPLVTRGAGESWTRPQQEVVDVFNAWAEAEAAGNLEGVMSLLAPAVTVWNFAERAPLDRATFQKSLTELLQPGRVVAMALPVHFVHIEGRTAVAHGRFTETVKDDSGAPSSIQGPWTASLVRDGRKWLVLGLGWAEDAPKVDEAAMKREVTDVFARYLAALEHKDAAGLLSIAADVPEFRHTHLDGRQYDFAGFKRVVTESFASWAEATVTRTAGRTDVRVLGPDAALVTWQGALEVTTGADRSLRADPYNLSALFKRIDGAWKVVAEHESSPPAQVLVAGKPAVPQPDEVVARLTRALNNHNVEAAVQLFAEDQVTVLPDAAQPLCGREAKRQMLAGLFRAFPDLAINCSLVVVAGECVVCSGTMRGTNTGPRVTPEGELPATGRQLDLPLTSVLKIGADGLVHSDHTFFDVALYRQQLGEGAPAAAPAAPVQLR